MSFFFQKQTGPTIFYTGDHRWIVNSKLTVIAQYTHITEDAGTGPRLAARVWSTFSTHGG